MSKRDKIRIPLYLLFLLLFLSFLLYSCSPELDRHIRESEPVSDTAEVIEEPLPESQPSDALKIASFNIRIFSDNSRDDEELGYMKDILSKYDIIAIQELRDEEVLKRAVNMLADKGFEYDYDISGKVGRGVKERYAFLYRKDKVAKLLAGRIFPDEDDKFIRGPFYATFKAGNFDFTMATIHLIYGDNKAERRLEARELDAVYQAIQDEDPNEQDIILTGDFNLPPSDEGFDELKAISTMAFLISDPEKTTITDTSLYDNFWFQKEFVKEYTGTSGIDKFDET